MIIMMKKCSLAMRLARLPLAYVRGVVYIHSPKHWQASQSGFWLHFINKTAAIIILHLNHKKCINFIKAVKGGGGGGGGNLWVTLHKNTDSASQPQICYIVLLYRLFFFDTATLHPSHAQIHLFFWCGGGWVVDRNGGKLQPRDSRSHRCLQSVPALCMEAMVADGGLSPSG